MNVSRGLFAAGLAAVAVLTATAAPVSAVTQVISMLAPLPNGTYGSANDINDSGVIVGLADIPGGGRAAKWTPDGRVTALSTPPNNDSVARAINNHGTIVGFSYVTNGVSTANRWAADGTIKALAKLPGYTNCLSQAINDSGAIVGRCYNDGWGRAVRWNSDGAITELAIPPGYQASRADGINAAGVIVGSLLTNEAGTKAVRWNPDGSVAVLANLSGGVFSSAWGINDSGQIAGTITISSPGFFERAVRWNANGAVMALQTPANAPYEHGVGFEISPDGTVVGETKDATNRFVAAAWSPSGTLTVLPSPGEGDWDNAYAINKRNVIVGIAGSKPVRWRGASGIPCTVKPFCTAGS